jgi:hypothetical protein
MPQDNAEDKLQTPGVTASGGSYRATAKGAVVGWLCLHVHSTQQSARTCADQHVREVGEAAHAISEPVS